MHTAGVVSLTSLPLKKAYHSLIFTASIYTGTARVVSLAVFLYKTYQVLNINLTVAFWFLSNLNYLTAKHHGQAPTIGRTR
jgi:hypothetical protein